MNEIPFPFNNGFAAWKRAMANAKPELRSHVFREVCREAASYVLGGLDRQLAVDECQSIAEAHDLGDVQSIMADEFSPRVNGATCSRLKPLDIADFCGLEIKPREMVLGPIIPEKGIVMVYSPRGMGKTRLSAGCALAVSTGTQFLKWNAPKPRKTLLLDGEMPAAALQDLLGATLESAATKPAPELFQVLAADLIEDQGIGNLADPKVQAEINQLLEQNGTEFLVLDNLSSLTAVLRDNDEASWQAMKFWLLALRRRGISVLLLHHAGKTGDQRGTSAREDVLDTSISLRHPSDYRHEEGCRFEVHFTKHRGFFGDDAAAFEAQQHPTAFGYEWTVKDIADANMARVAEMLRDEMSIRDIADELKLSKSAVHRIKQKIEGATRAN